MWKEALRPAWAEIDLDNLVYNTEQIKKKVGDRSIIGVVKADAYGHGSVEVSRVLMENGVSSLAVATLGEAVALRKAGFACPIIMLGLTPPLYAETIVEYGIMPVTASLSNATAISRAAVKWEKTVSVLIAVDTGMGRIGFLPGEDFPEEMAALAALPNLRVAGLFSHFATADEADKAYALEQTARFREFCDSAEEAGVRAPQRILANSAAIMELPVSWYDAVRPGIILYGCYPSGQMDRKAFPLRPVMSVKAGVVQVKSVPAGTSVSYGRTFTTRRESLIATLPLGYADGYPRLLSNRGRVLIRGQFAPVVGNVCMDQFMIDVTDVPGVTEGDEAVLMGRQGGKEILADEIAALSGTINYEVVCGFGQRLPKVYLPSR
ncbi:MAG: alanine racemase [Bacillota bacterium]|nr:alanine racemase [Bacillota bacterium]